MKTYVLQTTTGREIYVRDLLQSSAPTSDKARFWVPMKNRYWRSNQAELANGAERFQLKKDVLLPGYVLADTDNAFGLYEGLRKLQIKTVVTLIGRDKEQMETLARQAEKNHLLSGDPAAKISLHKVVSDGCQTIAANGLGDGVSDDCLIAEVAGNPYIKEFNASILSVTEKELDWIRALTGEVSEVEYIDKIVHFVSGPMVGLDGYVRRVDKRKRMLMVELPFFQNGEVNIWVAFDEVRTQ